MRLESAISCIGDMIAVGKNHVCNLKQDDTSNETIFHELSVLFPHFWMPTYAIHNKRQGLHDRLPIPECTAEKGKSRLGCAVQTQSLLTKGDVLKLKEQRASCKHSLVLLLV